MGEWYYSVGFFEEFIVGGGAGEGVLVAVRIVSSEDIIECGSYVGHWRCLGIRTIFGHEYLSISSLVRLSVVRTLNASFAYLDLCAGDLKYLTLPINTVRAIPHFTCTTRLLIK